MNNNEKRIRYLLVIFLVIYVGMSIFTLYRAKENSHNQNINQTVNINTVSDQSDKININTCSKEALESLPNIGENLADKIIAERPYKDVYELKNIDGIGDTIINNIKDRVVFE